MGQVLLARDPAIDRLVAIKLLKEGFDNAELRERFMREARSAGRLRHINIVTIFDVGEHESQPFIAMEYVEGETLYALIQRKAALSLGRKMQLMDELSAGLQYAHRAGIVHRDIKPKNVMLDADGVLKVLDFGIARVNDAGGGIKTQAGMLMGTLNYMAPEQMMGLPDIDQRADMFSAGAVFYELLTYRQAFPGGLESGILHKIINVSPEPMLNIDPKLDPGLVAIVDKCLEKSKENRYPDMAAVRRDIALLRRRLGLDLEDVAGGETIPGARVGTPDEGTPRPSRRDSSRQELARLRAAQIRTHLDDARKALEISDFTSALEASQRALLLDGDDRDALTYEHRARSALDERQAQQLLAEARSELDKGALTAASLLIGRAESLSPASREAAAVRTALEEARRALAEQQARLRALQTALAQAREALAAGAIDDASARIRDAFAIDSANGEARAIEREIAAAVEARRRAEEQARARTAIDSALKQFAAGRHDEAISLLEGFEPAALVAEAVGDLRLERDEIRRREAERLAEEQRKAAEAAERKRLEIMRTLDDASTKLNAREFDRALAIVGEVLTSEPAHADARALETRIKLAIERAAEEKRKQAEREEAERKRAAEQAARDKRLAEERAADEKRRVEARAAEEKRQREAEERAAEEKRQREAELAAKRAEEERLRVEERRREEERQREEQRKREEERKRQEERKREEERLAAEKRRAEERAAEERRRADERAALERTREAELTAKRLAEQPTVISSVSDTEATVVAPTSARDAARETTVVVTTPDVARQPLLAQPPAPVDEHVRPGIGKYVGLAAAAVLAVGLGIWMFATRTPDVDTKKPVPDGPPGSVVLDIVPWANIVEITRKADGRAVTTPCTVTPCVASLPAGDYHVKASNPNFPAPLEFDVAIEAGGVREVRQSIPGFKAEDEVSKILEK